MLALPEVVSALNNEPTRLTGKKPSEAIRSSSVSHKHSLPAKRAIGIEEPLIPSTARVRYLYAPGELEGGRRRATDPVWSLNIYTVRNVIRQAGQPALYHLDDGPMRGFVREELLIVPENTELPPEKVLIRREAR